jgi:hypothetical protein
MCACGLNELFKLIQIRQSGQRIRLSGRRFKVLPAPECVSNLPSDSFNNPTMIVSESVGLR